MLPEHVLMLHQAHRFIINVQPNFTCATVSVRLKNVDRIVPTTRRLAVMVKHPTECIMHRICGLLGRGYHDVRNDRITRYPQSRLSQGLK